MFHSCDKPSCEYDSEWCTWAMVSNTRDDGGDGKIGNVL